MKTYTVDDILAWGPCALWPKGRIRRVFERWGRSTFTAADVCNAIDVAIRTGHRNERDGLGWVLRRVAMDGGWGAHTFTYCSCGCSPDKDLLRAVARVREALAL